MQVTNQQENTIPFKTSEEFSALLKSLKYNEYCSSLFIYDEKLSDINASRRINFTKKWLEAPDINIFKYKFSEGNKHKEFSDLCKSLLFNTNIQILLLDGIALGDMAIKSLGACLKINSSIRYLTFLANGIGAAGAQILGEALAENEVLESLLLESNMLCASGAKHIAQSLRKNKTLTTLVLRGNKIGDTGAKYISELLKDNSALQALGLGDNEITDEGIILISESLMTNQSLKHLWIGENKVGAAGAASLAKVLIQSDCKLQSLWASGNKIGNEGAYCIADAIKLNESLNTLTLDKNGIKSAGMSSLANSLKFNRTLVNLWLDGNEADDEVIRNFADAAKFSDALETIWLSADGVSLAAYDYFAEILRINESIKNVIFGGDGIDLESFAIFQEKVKAINAEKKSYFDSVSYGNGFSCEGYLDANVDSINSENSLDISNRKTNEFKKISIEKKEQINKFNSNGNNKNPSDNEAKAINETDLYLKKGNNSNNANNKKNKQNNKNESATGANCVQDNLNNKKNTYLDHIANTSSNQPKITEEVVNNINLISNEKADFNEIIVEKCFRSFSYLNLIESIFLKCLKCKKIFDDSNLSFIEKNFVDHINIDNENLLNNEDFFDKEEFDLKDLLKAKKNRNKKHNRKEKEGKFMNDNDDTGNRESLKKDLDAELNKDLAVNNRFKDNGVHRKIEIVVETTDDKIRERKESESDTLSTQEASKSPKSCEENNTPSFDVNPNAGKKDSSKSIKSLHTQASLKSTDETESPFNAYNGNSNENHQNNKKTETNTRSSDFNISCYLINFKEIEILKNPKDDSPLIIKRGTFSNTILGLYWDKIISLKQIDLKKVDHDKILSEVKQILHLQNSENYSKHLARILGFAEADSFIYLVSKFNESCNLFNLIHEQKLILPIKNLIVYITNIVEAINFRHKNNLLLTHKDLKLENVFIAKDGSNAFLDDYGIAKHFYTNKSKNKRHCGTIYYMAPELLKGEEYCFSADIYSFGILLFEIFSKKVPYENLTDLDIIKNVVAGQRPDLRLLREDTPRQFIELMIKCWSQTPAKRPSIEDILYFIEN